VVCCVSEVLFAGESAPVAGASCAATGAAAVITNSSPLLIADSVRLLSILNIIYLLEGRNAGIHSQEWSESFLENPFYSIEPLHRRRWQAIYL
jgi:hypothetical protein